MTSPAGMTPSNVAALMMRFRRETGPRFAGWKALEVIPVTLPAHPARDRVPCGAGTLRRIRGTIATMTTERGPVRVAVPFIADERKMLASWLDLHRDTLLVKCEGLSPEQLVTRSVRPSELSLLGLVRHMAEVERNWFQRVLRGAEAPPHYREDDPDADFRGTDPLRATEDFSIFRSECDDSRAVEASATSLDDVDRGGGISLRWIMVHMIEEYARHNGHADLLRERIDGARGV